MFSNYCLLIKLNPLVCSETSDVIIEGTFQQIETHTDIQGLEQEFD